MKPKKNHGANLEQRRAMHIQVGLIIALSFVLVSLEWGTHVSTTQGAFYVPDYDLTEEIPILIKRDEPVKPDIPKVLIPFPVDESLIDIDEVMPEWYTPEYTGNGIDITLPPDDPEPQFVETFNPWEVNIKPEFPGGEAAMMKWLYDNISYPLQCVEHGIAGKVTAKFTISKYGKVTDIVILRGAHQLLDDEVIRILSLMPDFRPGMQGGQLVAVYMHVPVVFDLR